LSLDSDQQNALHGLGSTFALFTSQLEKRVPQIVQAEPLTWLNLHARFDGSWPEVLRRILKSGAAMAPTEVPYNSVQLREAGPISYLSVTSPFPPLP
jgi:hypothetical protein